MLLEARNVPLQALMIDSSFLQDDDCNNGMKQQGTTSRSEQGNVGADPFATDHLAIPLIDSPMLKKRRIETVSDNDSPRTQDDTIAMTSTKLQRQVASCWDKCPGDTTPVESTASATTAFNWQEVTKLPPTSGPYFYADRYIATDFSLRSNSKRPCLIEDHDYESEEETVIPPEFPTECPFSRAVAAHVVKADHVASLELEDDGELDQELHMLSLQCYSSKEDHDKSNTYYPTSPRSGSNVAVTPTPDWGSFAPIQDQAITSASWFMGSTPRDHMPDGMEDLSVKEGEKQHANPALGPMPIARHAIQGCQKSVDDSQSQQSERRGSSSCSSYSPGRALGTTGPVSFSTIKLSGFLKADNALAVQNVMQEAVYPTPHPSPDRHDTPAPCTTWSNLSFTEEQSREWYVNDDTTLDSSDAAGYWEMSCLEENASADHSIGSTLMAPAQDRPIFIPVPSEHASSAIAPGFSKETLLRDGIDEENTTNNATTA